MCQKASQQDQPTLFTSKDTVITSSSIDITPKVHDAELFRKVEFPVQNFDFAARKVQCSKCKNNVLITPGKNYNKWSSSNMSSRCSNLPVARSAKVSFHVDGPEVTLYNAQLSEYAAKKK